MLEGELIYGSKLSEHSAVTTPKRAMFDTDQVDKNLIADLLLILVILLVVVGGFIALHTESILLGGSLAVTVAVVAEYVWSRTGKP